MQLFFKKISILFEKLLDGFRRNLVGGIRYGPRIMQLDFGLGPKAKMAAIAAILDFRRANFEGMRSDVGSLRLGKVIEWAVCIGEMSNIQGANVFRGE